MSTVERLASPTHDEDAHLVQRIRSRDQEALGHLYDRWGQRVYAVALHLLGSAPDAEEVVEKVFSQVWAEADRYHAGRGSVEAWIILIARTRALDRLRLLRTRLRREEPLDERRADGAPAAAHSPLQDAADGEQRDIIGRALDKLPADQQRVVHMTFYEGLTQTQIAERLGIPLGTVKTRTRLAFPKLRALLSGLRDAE